MNLFLIKLTNIWAGCGATGRQQHIADQCYSRATATEDWVRPLDLLHCSINYWIMSYYSYYILIIFLIILLAATWTWRGRWMRWARRPTARLLLPPAETVRYLFALEIFTFISLRFSFVSTASNEDRDNYNSATHWRHSHTAVLFLNIAHAHSNFNSIFVDFLFITISQCWRLCRWRARTNS